MAAIAVTAAVIWIGILIAPWRAWSTRERLDEAPASTGSDTDLSDVTILIPARNESALILPTLEALARQGRDLSIVLIDDQSDDETAELAESAGLPGLRVIRGEPLKSGWRGKVWALEQGRRVADRPLITLLDADIVLAPGMLAALRRKMLDSDLALISIMVELRMASFWGRLLNPAFIYFFKLLYPFRLANSQRSFIAAAAGGCIMVRAEVLAAIGGFCALHDALIDDCALAKLVKQQGFRTWIGLTRRARSLREDDNLSAIWRTVVRSAYSQLRYSVMWLIVCTAFMVAAFAGPLAALFASTAWVKWVAAGALSAMFISYLPTLKYYRLSWSWGLGMPLIGALFLVMTWHSAMQHWQGSGSRWKGRVYCHRG